MPKMSFKKNRLVTKIEKKWIILYVEAFINALFFSYFF